MIGRASLSLARGRAPQLQQLQRLHSTAASTLDSRAPESPALERGVLFTFPPVQTRPFSTGDDGELTARPPPRLHLVADRAPALRAGPPQPITIGEVVKAERLENARTKRIDRCERSASSQFSLPIDPASSWFVDRDMPLGVCVTTMVEKNVASVLVTGRVLPGIRGIFSERDYLLKVAATDEDPRELTVGDVMSTRVTAVTEDADLDTCLTLMAEENIRRLPVLRSGAEPLTAAPARKMPQDDMVGMMTSSLLIRTLARLYLGELKQPLDSATEEVRSLEVGDLLAAQGDEDFVRERHTISHDADTLEMCEKMSHSAVGSLAVMDGDTVVGVVSEREYMRNVAAKPYTGKGFAHSVLDIMRPAHAVDFLSPQHTVEDAMLVMADHPSYESTHRHLPVVDEGRIVGMLSIRDIKKAVAAAGVHAEPLAGRIAWREEYAPPQQQLAFA